MRLLPLLLIALLSSSARGQVVPGVTLNFDANDPASVVDGTNWNSLVGSGTHDWDFGADVLFESVASSLTTISNAFRFTGATGDIDNGTWETDFDTQGDASWELWLRPDDTGTLDSAQILFEVGGAGDGFAIWYQPGATGDMQGTVLMTVDDDDDNQTASAVVNVSDFRHLTAVYDKDTSGADLLALYVDGLLATTNTASNILNDWAGSNGPGLGGMGGGSLAEGVSTGAFTGAISVFRFWDSRALTAAEVSTNFAVFNVDETAPLLLSISPTNGASDVQPQTSLAVMFDETITTNSGFVILSNLTDGARTVIPVGDPQLSVAGAGLTITPSSQFLFPKTYAVVIPAGVIEDASGNAFAGISGSLWSFATVPDSTPPTVLDISDDQSGGPVSTNDLVTFTVTFSELMNGASIEVGDFDNAGTAPAAVLGVTEVSNPVFTVTMQASSGGSLDFRIPNSADIRDAAGNPLGVPVTHATSINVDTEPPTVTSITNDQDGGTNTYRFLPVRYTVTFSEDIDDTTVSVDDFRNAGTATAEFLSVFEVADGVFAVRVRATTIGTLRLEIPVSATIDDVFGNPFGTGSPQLDDETLTVRYAELLFEEDFESPSSPTAYAQGTSPDNGQWVRASAGHRSSYHGITDKAGGDFAAPDPNHQAYAFRYTNSGLTSQSNRIAQLTEDVPYIVAFDVVRDRTALPYRVDLIAFATNAPRNDCRSVPAGSKSIRSASGSAPSDGRFQQIRMSVTGSATTHSGYIGYDLGVRLDGATTTASFDNVIVLDATIPPPPAGTVLILR